MIGFGFWWIYFDLVGRRLPASDGGALATWLLSHLPITLSITAAGAAMVSLIGHAHDARTPASTAWLLAGSVAVGLLALIPPPALADAQRLAVVYRPVDGRWPSAPPSPLVAGWIAAGAMAARPAARRGPLGRLVPRRQPLPPALEPGVRAVAPRLARAHDERPTTRRRAPCGALPLDVRSINS